MQDATENSFDDCFKPIAIDPVNLPNDRNAVFYNFLLEYLMRTKFY